MEAGKIFDQELPEKFAIIGLRIDNPDSIEKTRRMLDGLRQMQEATSEFKHETMREIAKAFVTWLGIGGAALLTFFGLKGGGH